MEKIVKLLEADKYDEILSLLKSTTQQLNINQFLEMGRTIAHFASKKGRLDIILELSKRPNFDINFACKFNKNCILHFAAQNGHDKIIKFCLSNGASINQVDKDGYTALHFACLNRHEGIVKMLCGVKGIKINIQDSMKRTALHRAVEAQSIVAVKEILKLKPLIDVQDSVGQTPLHYASLKGDNEICLILSKNGASANIKDKSGKKALYWGFGFELED